MKNSIVKVLWKEVAMTMMVPKLMANENDYDRKMETVLFQTSHGASEVTPTFEYYLPITYISSCDRRVIAFPVLQKMIGMQPVSSKHHRTRF